MAVYRFPVEISHTSITGSAVNTWHVRTTGAAPSTAGELTGLSNIIKAFYAGMKAFSPVTTTFRYAGVATTIAEEPEIDESAPAWTETATAAGTPMPPSCAVVIGWRTALANRRGRGRTFFSPLSVATLQSDGTVIDSSLATMRTLATTLVSSSTGFANGAIGVYSVKDQVLRDVTSSVIRDQYAVIRSRRD